MIPKIIHLCWFSGDKYPLLIKVCIASWKKHLPEYRVKIWTEKNARDLNIPYINQALDNNKYAFAADVVRLYALHQYGGIYLDSDIYVKSNFSNLLNNDFVTFMEYHPSIIDSTAIDSTGCRIPSHEHVRGIGIQAAFLASCPNHHLITELLDYYRNRNFINQDGSFDTSIIAPDHYAKIFEKYGFRYCDETQILGGGNYL